jgi:hypothetical protein
MKKRNEHEEFTTGHLTERIQDDYTILPDGHLLERIVELDLLIHENERYLNYIIRKKCIILNEMQRREFAAHKV